MNYENGISLPLTVGLNGNNGGNSGFGDNSGWWIILLLLALGGWNGNGGFGNNGGNSGGNYFNDGYAWLSNGQKEIMQNTNNGFNTLQLGNQLNDISSGVQNLSTQLCNCCADMNANVSSAFANAETAANARQMANIQQAFNTQTAMMQGFNSLQSDLNQCCCDNRLATCQTQNIVQNEGNATRFADANNTRDIIESQNRNSQAILDKLCQLELDGIKAQVEAKNDVIAGLRTQLNMADLRASQTAQTADIRTNNAQVANQLVNELRSCPIPAQPVYRKSTYFYMQPKLE